MTFLTTSPLLIAEQIAFYCKIANKNASLKSYLKQFDLAPPSSLARAEASFGRVHPTALGGIRELQQKEQDDNGDDDLFAVTHLNP